MGRPEWLNPVGTTVDGRREMPVISAAVFLTGKVTAEMTGTIAKRRYLIDDTVVNGRLRNCQDDDGDESDDNSRQPHDAPV